MGKYKVFLGFILALAFFLRVWQLPLLELFGDELDVGYHAYSLWRTRRDYMGQKFPFYIHSFSEWRAPLLMYATAPFVGILGLNEWGVRLPPVLFGVANIFLLYLLVRALTNDEKLGLMAALLLALTPWHIHYSRAAFEATLLLTLVLLGTILFLKRKWFLSSTSFVLSFYTYNTANVFVPAWVAWLLWTNKRKIKESKKQVGMALLLGVVLLAPLIWATIKGPGSARFRLISIFNDRKLLDEVVFKRTTGGSSSGLERFFHNKLTAWGKAFVKNYYSALSPQFLFLSGDPNPRHNPPGFGQVYWWLAPFLFLGGYRLAQSKNKQAKRLIFAWLLLAPLPASLTVGGGVQATRLFLLLPPLIFLLAFGWKAIFQDRQVSDDPGSSSLLLLLLLVLSWAFWWHNYQVHYPKESYQWWHFGYKQAFLWLKNQEVNYHQVLVNNAHEPALLRYLFWTQKDPHWLWANFEGDQVKKDILPGFDGFRVGSVYFGSITWKNKLEWLFANLEPGDLYLAFQKDEVPGDWNWEKDPPEGIKVLKTIYDPWGEPMMYWITKI